MTTIISRFCIAKGMPEDLAYKLSDVYIKGADELNSVDEIQNLQWSMVKNYTEYMMKRRAEGVTSKQIRECLSYIRKNIHSNITVSELAEVVDLNETYLSKLFKKEMKRTVSEFIRDEKIEEACWLLRYTDKTSIEIATDLSFSSHSYFISVFKKVKGVRLIKKIDFVIWDGYTTLILIFYINYLLQLRIFYLLLSNAENKLIINLYVLLLQNPS